MKTIKAKSHLEVAVHFSHANVDEMHLKDKNVVVIDVLRASTSIAMALQNGAKEIIPVNSVENAVKISGSLYGDVTLRAGERNAKMIEGFNLGNSPLEYRVDVVNGKSIILMTTNGSVAIVKGKHAKNLIVAGFINLSKVVEFLKTLKDNFTIICAGNENNFCLEDAVCAGRIINTLETVIEDELLLDDGGITCAALDKHFGKSILKMLKTSDHGRYISEIGFSEDLKVCASIDSINVLPMLAGNVLRLQKELPSNSTRKT
ncbi:MAG: 2-phosphosulfolactate phosphatase [Bacteroidota bacterium]|nr:2-phosphosulfolactate phosphatase [Bacteroidota bacterium]